MKVTCLLWNGAAKTFLLWSGNVVFQVPYQACVDRSFHEFAHTTGGADRTVAVSVCSILTLLVDWYHVCFSPALRTCPVFQLLLKISRSFDFASLPKCSGILLVILLSQEIYCPSGFSSCTWCFLLFGIMVHEKKDDGFSGSFSRSML